MKHARLRCWMHGVRWGRGANILANNRPTSELCWLSLPFLGWDLVLAAMVERNIGGYAGYSSTLPCRS